MAKTSRTIIGTSLGIYFGLITTAHAQSLPPSLQSALPQCAQECLKSDIAQYYNSICLDLTSIDCLCSRTGTNGLSVEDLVYECTYSNGLCTKDQLPKGLTPSTVCSQVQEPTVSITKASHIATPTQQLASATTQSAVPGGNKLTTSQVTAIIVGSLAVVLAAVIGLLYILRKGKSMRNEVEDGVKAGGSFRNRPLSEESFGNQLEIRPNHSFDSSMRQSTRNLEESNFSSEKLAEPQEQTAWPKDHRMILPSQHHIPHRSLSSRTGITRAGRPQPLTNLPNMVQPNPPVKIDEVYAEDIGNIKPAPRLRPSLPIVQDMPDSPTVRLFVPQLIDSHLQNDDRTQEVRHQRNSSKHPSITELPVDLHQREGSTSTLGLEHPELAQHHRSAPQTYMANVSSYYVPLTVDNSRYLLHQKSPVTVPANSGEISGPLGIEVNAPPGQPSSPPPQKPLPPIPTEEEISDIETDVESEDEQFPVIFSSDSKSQAGRFSRSVLDVQGSIKSLRYPQVPRLSSSTETEKHAGAHGSQASINLATQDEVDNFPPWHAMDGIETSAQQTRPTSSKYSHSPSSPHYSAPAAPAQQIQTAKSHMPESPSPASPLYWDSANPLGIENSLYQLPSAYKSMHSLYSLPELPEPESEKSPTLESSHLRSASAKDLSLNHLGPSPLPRASSSQHRVSLGISKVIQLGPPLEHDGSVWASPRFTQDQQPNQHRYSSLLIPTDKSFPYAPPTTDHTSPSRAFTLVPISPPRSISLHQTPPRSHGFTIRGTPHPARMLITPPRSPGSRGSNKRATGEDWSVKMDGRPVEEGYYEYDFF